MTFVLYGNKLALSLKLVFNFKIELQLKLHWKRLIIITVILSILKRERDFANFSDRW
jgi:hypothetical protein